MRQPIRTILFSSLYPSSVRPNHGIFVESRLRHLLESGEVETRVVAPVPWFPSRHPRFGKWAASAATPAHEIRNGIEVWHPRYPLPPKIGMNVAPLALALGARATIARIIEGSNGIDLFDAHYYYPDGAAAALLSTWFHKPFIVTARGSDLNLLPNYRVPRRWIQWAGRKAAASVTVSGALRERLIQLGGEPSRIRVIHNGVDLSLFRPLDRAACRTALGLRSARWMVSVGNLVALKGHDIAIQALATLPRGWCLAIIGEGEERVRLEAMARRLQVDDRLHFVGTVAQPALVRWYNMADVLVLCSSREGLPNVVLEALACGTPVVATNVGGVSEALRSPGSGRLLAERTPAALAAAVVDLFSSNLSRTGVREFASRFDWRETTRRQIELLRMIVSGEQCATS